MQKLTIIDKERFWADLKAEIHGQVKDMIEKYELSPLCHDFGSAGHSSSQGEKIEILEVAPMDLCPKSPETPKKRRKLN